VASERGAPVSDNMGWTLRIANPLKLIRASCVKGSSAPLPEQRVSSGAVRGGLVAVGRHPRDFRFEQRDPFIQLGLRIGGEVFACEAIRRV